MKCAIFFCLLACCAFQTVFSNALHQAIEMLRSESMKKISEVEDRLHSAIAAEFEAAERKGVHYTSLYACGNHFDDFWHKYINPATVQCMHCREQIINIKKVQAARKCSFDVIASVEHQAKLTLAKVQSCTMGFIHEVQALVRGPRSGRKNIQIHPNGHL
ncbi:uncharacterized protein LOC117175666 [Belonocnema kinseyi]|uniref:uncharacterized protein LOC117175666 n=1 Tax=Belonocnema kinseyi TaxID=2817044 RepID=UPI00143E0DD3|nr:uncharacterized protein LOC117175666 [Belonocnema kinseyi]